MNHTSGSSVISALAELKSRLGDRPPRLLVVGDVMLDRYVRGKASRLSPEAPAPIVDVNNESCFPGGAGNVMQNLAMLGAEVIGVCVVGEDDCGRQIRELLDSGGVDTARFVGDPDRLTPEKTRIHTDSQQLIRIDRETTDPLTPDLEAELLASVDISAESFAAIVLCDYGKGVLTTRVLRELIGRARQHDIPVLIDPKGVDASRYQGATLISPNRDEAERLAGVETHTDESLELAGRILLERTQAPHVVITLADEGLAAFGRTPLRIPAAPCEVHDVSGAGDTFLAMMSLALSCGMSFETSAELARDAAAVAVSRYGTAAVTLDEIHQAHAKVEWSSSNEASDLYTVPFPGVARASASDPPPVYRSASDPSHVECHHARSFAEIESITTEARGEGQRVVFTNGCFDLLHPGHVTYLNGSRQCGDMLIVGLNSDCSVRRLKGHGRPVHGEEDRVRMLLALRCVDHVVVFDEDTPTNLIRRIQPDVLTKGGDYTVEQVVGAELVDDVRLIPFVVGQSTSATINRIRDAG